MTQETSEKAGKNRPVNSGASVEKKGTTTHETSDEKAYEEVDRKFGHLEENQTTMFVGSNATS